MQSIIDAIEQWIRDFLIGAVTGNLSGMFHDVNSKVATIASEAVSYTHLTLPTICSV